MTANGSSGINNQRIPQNVNLPPASAREAARPPRDADFFDSIDCETCCCGIWAVVKGCLSEIYTFFADLCARCFGRDAVAHDPLTGENLVLELERAVYTVRLNPQQYGRMRARFEPILAEFPGRIILDHHENTIHLNYDQITIRALAEKFQPFRELLRLSDVLLIPPTEKRDALIAEGTTFFARHRSAPPRPDLRGIETQSYRELLEALLERADGICLLEWHGDSSPKYVPAINMDLLKASGVRRIYIEDLCHETLQPELDDFLAGRYGDKLPKVLDAYLTHLEKNQTGSKGYSERDIILGAKRAGDIRIIACDSEAAKQAFEIGPKERLLAYNYLTLRIERSCRGEGKSLFLFGAAHGHDTLGVPGIATLFGYPTLLLKDAAPCFEKGVHKNFRTTYQGVPVAADFALVMDAARKS